MKSWISKKSNKVGKTSIIFIIFFGKNSANSIVVKKIIKLNIHNFDR